VKAYETDRSGRMSLARLAGFRAVRLFVFGLIGWLLFMSAADSAWRAVSLAAVLALAALVGVTWYLSRARAQRRWRGALDAYVEQEQAKEDSRRRSAISATARWMPASNGNRRNGLNPGETFLLVLRRKIGERIVVPHYDLAVTLLAIDGKTVRLGIAAPAEVEVYREEVWQQKSEVRGQKSEIRTPISDL